MTGRAGRRPSLVLQSRDAARRAHAQRRRRAPRGSARGEASSGPAAAGEARDRRHLARTSTSAAGSRSSGCARSRTRGTSASSSSGTTRPGSATRRAVRPSGRSCSDEEIDRNAQTYVDQAMLILDPERTEVRRNGEWLSQLTFADVVRLTRTITVARLLERDDFAKRYAAREPISVSELLYPLMQAYDSVAVQADVELGGTDQLYNLLAGRDVMESYGLEPQVVLTNPLLLSWDGEKMSSSVGNNIPLTAAPEEQFGRTMRLPDDARRLVPARVGARAPAGRRSARGKARARAVRRGALARGGGGSGGGGAFHAGGARGRRPGGGAGGDASGRRPGAPAARTRRRRPRADDERGAPADRAGRRAVEGEPSPSSTCRASGCGTRSSRPESAASCGCATPDGCLTALLVAATIPWLSARTAQKFPTTTGAPSDAADTTFTRSLEASGASRRLFFGRFAGAVFENSTA